MRSYIATRLGVVSRLQEMYSLYRLQKRDIGEQVRVSIERLRQVEQDVFSNTGVCLEHLTMLDIGPGQKLKQMAYFSAKNQVIGVDLDVIAQGCDFRAYFQMALRNGWLRLLKTLLRQVSGIDGRYKRELAQQLGLSRIPRFRVHEGDATALPFGDASFDCVYSFSVFQSIPCAGEAATEVVRVLRPGGIAYISLHNYASDNGHGDPLWWTQPERQLVHWPHLRSRYSHLVACNAYLNRLRLSEWRFLLDKHMPGAVFISRQWGRDELAPILDALRAENELNGYSDDELLTVDFAALWRKPG